jgi:hyperosmotically inducible protein
MVTDAFITAQVKTLLLKRSILKDLDIQVETKDGVVRLSGVVQDEEQVVQALETASKAEGVARQRRGYAFVKL